MHIAEQGEEPLVVLLHGFPESWYSWRHQLPALADAGYHAVAPD
jgi:pimeloyl-ACP methyl ester carboxylesterase